MVKLRAFRCGDELWAEIGEAAHRERVSRTEWVRSACEHLLGSVEFAEARAKHSTAVDEAKALERQLAALPARSKPKACECDDPIPNRFGICERCGGST